MPRSFGRVQRGRGANYKPNALTRGISKVGSAIGNTLRGANAELNYLGGKIKQGLTTPTGGARIQRRGGFRGGRRPTMAFKKKKKPGDMFNAYQKKKKPLRRGKGAYLDMASPVVAKTKKKKSKSKEEMMCKMKHKHSKACM